MKGPSSTKPSKANYEPAMRFSWKAILLAPLAVPFITGLVLAASLSGRPLMNFVFFFGLAAALSYGASVFVLLPGLYLVSRFAVLTAWLAGLVGTGLGLALYFPVGWVSYRASGDNSGPPTGTFGEYLWHGGATEAWPFLAGGLITALVYWFLAKPRNPCVATEKAEITKAETVK
jgi:hypothetical protein